MCFRPAEAELPPVMCPSCGKKINRIGGALPSKCPFCKEPTDGIEDAAAAPAAIGAFSEDPKAFGKALIFVALGEGVALYGLLISILIINKL